MKIEPAVGFYDCLEGKSLLLDTSVFIDCLFASNGNKFKKFIEEIKNKEIPLIIPHAVEIEYLKGAKSSDEHTSRKNLIHGIVDQILPYTPDLDLMMEEICKRMGQPGAKASYTDILLGTILKKYHNRLMLLSKNLLDFPSTVYSMESFVTMIYPRSILNYGLYQYKQISKKPD